MSTTVNYKGSTIATVNNATKTLNTAGTWVEGDITLVDVTPGKYTATLIADGRIYTRYVRSNGTKYFTSGETFSFNGGDSLYIYATDSMGGSGEIYIDDVRVVGAQGYAEYTYTLPESNIEVSFGSNSTSVNSVSAISLQSKSVSYTPSETAQSATVTADSGYDGLGSVDISVGAISGAYVGSQVPTQAAQTIHPSTQAQTIASGKYLTGDQTIEAVTTTNLTAANIKSGVVVKVGSATDDDSVLSLTGTAETGGATLEDEANTTGTTAVITGTEGGGSSTTENAETALKDVTFIDYEGTILHEYTKSEFLELTALPENPSHNGLIAQGWNWSLSDAQTYVSKWDCLVIGQNYTTSDGKTRIYINVTDTFIEHGQTFLLKFTCSVNGGAVIDWGDGDTTTSSGTALGTYSHTYTTAGEYVVTIDVAESATINLGYNGSNNGFFYTDNGNVPARHLVNRIEIGDRVTRFNRYCFHQCINLKSISLPSAITQIGNTVGYAFDRTGLTALVIPRNVTFLPSMTFHDSYDIKFVSIPNGITGMSTNVISSETLPNLRALTFPDTITLTAAPGIISFDCYKLERFVFQSVYNGTLNGGYLRNNYYCRKIIIPEEVTTIADYAMTSTSGLQEMYLFPETPPTIANTRGMPALGNATIYVPYSEDHSILEAYQTATNWSSYAARMVEMPQEEVSA